jgi:hypothetical protein
MANFLPALAKFSARVHGRLTKTPLGPLYLTARRHMQHIQDEATYLTWRVSRSRPHLNRDTVRHLISEPSISVNGVIPGRLLTRVAFHLRRWRVKYLVEVVEQLRALPFSDVVIAVDTNSADAVDFIQRFCPVDDVKVHAGLTDPRRLTWAHRDAMRTAFPHFDYFLYTEDDILLPPAAVAIWRERLPSLVKHGFLPGFLRVEENRQGRLVASDFSHQDSPEQVVFIDERPYLHTTFPYQAMWLYDKETMRAFLASDTFTAGHVPSSHKPLESAALGFTFDDRNGEYRSRHLLPLTSSMQVDPSCYVFHMPSNYGRSLAPHPAKLGTIPVDHLIEPLPL